MKSQRAKIANPMPRHKNSTNKPIRSERLILGLSNHRAQSFGATNLTCATSRCLLGAKENCRGRKGAGAHDTKSQILEKNLFYTFFEKKYQEC